MSGDSGRHGAGLHDAVENTAFGLADAEGNALPQPHGSLRAAMLVPFADSFAALRRVFAPFGSGVSPNRRLSW